MKIPKNLEVFKYSMQHSEAMIDEFFLKKVDLLIGDSKNKLSDVVLKNRRLIKLIESYSKLNNRQGKIRRQIQEQVVDLLQDKQLNVSEFVSFWPTLDMSYSAYSIMSIESRLTFIEEALKEYIENRHKFYKIHGYSDTTLQASLDAKAHKKSGEIGGRKVAELLLSNGFICGDEFSLNQVLASKEKIFVRADKSGKKLFQELLKYWKIQFRWSGVHEGKNPDFLLSVNGHIFIVEHKHMNEGGGGQDKQVSEVIDFIRYKEIKKGVHYVTFLDGGYFNLFIRTERDGKKNKVYRQIESVKENLKKNPNNYFVNTAGFKKLLKSL